MKRKVASILSFLNVIINFFEKKLSSFSKYQICLQIWGLIFSLQSCSYSSPEKNLSPTSEKILAEYSTLIDDLAAKNSFQTEICPTILSKLTDLNDSGIELRILSEIINFGYLDGEILRNHNPQEWKKQLTSSYINKFIPQLPDPLKNKPSINEHLRKFGESIYSIEDLHRHVKTLAEKIKNNEDYQQFERAFQKLKDYNLQENTHNKFTEIVTKSDIKDFIRQTHNLCVNNTFLEENELSLDEIIEKVSAKSIYKKDDLKKKYDAVKKALNSKSDFAIKLNINKKISEFNEEDIKQWSKFIRSTKDSVKQNEIIAGVIHAANISHNNIKVRDTQLCSLICFLEKPKAYGMLGQINTGEGKSLIVAMLSAILGLQNKFVDIITTSMELAVPEVEK